MEARGCLHRPAPMPPPPPQSTSGNTHLNPAEPSVAGVGCLKAKIYRVASINDRRMNPEVGGTARHFLDNGNAGVLWNVDR